MNRNYVLKTLAGWTLLMAFLLIGCGDSDDFSAEHGVDPVEALKSNTGLSKPAFDTVLHEKQVGLYWIQNDSILVGLTNYGGRVVGLWVPDRSGTWTDVVVGMGSIRDYLHSTEPYFGATIGRVGNRIAHGRFELAGESYQIPVNNGENALHGGINGFHDVVWDVAQPDTSTIVFHYRSTDGEQGFPGNLEVEVTYSVDEHRALKMEYKATTDQTTVVNLTNHAFFNLNGEGQGSILDHKVVFFADQYTPVDAGLIPTGELSDVVGSPFDFTEEHTIGERIHHAHPQLEHGGGYDHNYVLNGTQAHGMNYAAHIVGDQSGIVMDVYTQEPGMQFYSGNFMQGQNVLKSGTRDDYRTAFALETQHFPDAPNQADFPSIVLEPNERYHTISKYQFSIE